MLRMIVFPFVKGKDATNVQFIIHRVLTRYNGGVGRPARDWWRVDGFLLIIMDVSNGEWRRRTEGGFSNSGGRNVVKGAH